MFEHSNLSARSLSLASLLLVIFTTAVHHVFRLGPELIPLAVGMFAVPIVVLALYDKMKHMGLLLAYSLYAALMVVWFGIVDGFLDHVLKALGLENTTFLPGGEAEVVATVYSLWSPAATSAFYEGTGVLTFILSIGAVVYGMRFLNQELRSQLGRGKHGVVASTD